MSLAWVTLAWPPVPNPLTPSPSPKASVGGEERRGVRGSNSGSVAEEPRGQSPFQWPMTGQDWGSEGLASDQAGAKGPLHIMTMQGRLECCGVCVCVCVCVLPPTAQIYSRLQPVNLGDLEASLREWPLSFRSGYVEWRHFRSKEVLCCFKPVCLLAHLIGSFHPIDERWMHYGANLVKVTCNCLCSSSSFSIFGDHAAYDFNTYK